jgi:hypothetical protein
MRTSSVAACLFALLVVVAPVRADDLGAFSSPNPAVSTFGASSMPRPSGLLPVSLFDPTRFSISNSMTFGYSTGSTMQGSSGLFTSRLGYRLAGNAALRFDVGAHMNPAFGAGGTEKGVFLQGASLDWKPTQNSLVRFQYNDVRSPLQGGWGYGGYGPGSPYGYGLASPWGGGYGFGEAAPFGSGLPGDPLRN